MEEDADKRAENAATQEENIRIRFGTGGWRAVIGDGFTKKNIELLAKAMCVKMKREGVADRGIILGYDRRFLSKEAMQWAGCVFAAEGIRAFLVNKSPDAADHVLCGEA